MSKKDLKLEIPPETETITGDAVESHAPTLASGQGQGQGAPGLSRQPSMTKNNCLCSPTMHAGSFRCRVHRAPTLQRTKSIESQSATVDDNTSKPSSATEE
ncbi:Phototropic-responsive NPH3 family protein [Hibiscus syriacus]|uniref:Phototropic-responsive NPH3 family protein n=1 Tax=Hibiscus syriacus TaxID=106335 RepID=A0A6A2X7G7_HIBSY|nr:uncharacterized protein LOC120182627 [Hibiscus syriacus]XP_039062777.1 uncharacterized protein LOC120207378 [Hibiscus syriacus]KAE8665010.1 Phototropic-responsive NPH3 family protein [Hibiscus syriacus]KAE8721981.1 Phototropic-responsive NPH3 family protein [Hibiscus syriacus]